MRNGILKSMGMDDMPTPTEYQIGYGFEVVFEPNVDTVFRLRNEQAARQAAGDSTPMQIHLSDEEMDVVTYEVYLAQRKGGVMLAGGMIPQAKIRGREVSRMPKAELTGRVDQAFLNSKG